MIQTYAWESLRPAEWERLAAKFSAYPGRVAVLMVERQHELRGIELPDTVQARNSADIGVVLSSGAVTKLPWWPQGVSELEPGDMVLTHPTYHGKRVAGFSREGREVRFFGVDTSQFRTSKDFPWDESIMAKIVGDKIQAVGTRVCIKLPPPVDNRNGVLIPDECQHRQDFGWVESVGQGVTNIEVGSKVLFSKHALIEVVREDGAEYGIIDASGIYCELLDV